MSSIVNGLVYFDQFALLSTLKLAMVSLGMVTLLGGVWVVSFHAGSGRVDVGTWQEGDDDLEEEEVREASTAQIENGLGYTSPVFSPGVMESALSDSEALHSPAIMAHSITFPISPQAAEPSQPTPFTHPLSPTAHTHSGTAASGQPPRRRRTRISLLQPSESGSSALNVPTGGFSIGLSPISPGFAIVPKRRLGKFRRVVARATMRRTLSESDVNGPARTSRVVSAPLLGRHASQQDDVAADADSRAQKKAMARWKWLKDIFVDNTT